MTELEKIGLIPRSIVRMLDRFYYQLYLGTAEPLVKQFRFSKYLLLTSVKSLLLVFFIPFFINLFTKIYIFRPLVEYFWDRKQTEIFLTYELQEKAFYEIKNFEEKMYFDYLIKTDNHLNKKQNWGNDTLFSVNTGNLKTSEILVLDFEFDNIQDSLVLAKTESFCLPQQSLVTYLAENNKLYTPDYSLLKKNEFLAKNFSSFFTISCNVSSSLLNQQAAFNSIFYDEKSVPKVFVSELGGILLLDNKQVQNFSQLNSNKQEEFVFLKKTRELAEHYNNESIEAITNLFSDFMGLIILLFLLINMKMSLMNTTAFLSESFFSLKDSKKAFLMLLFTDLLVGFHSPRGWEVIFHFIFEHFGLPENQNIIFLLVGTFPVLLDALFKYWIFRHLNRHSPATVATFQAMVE
uniref:Potassium/proton antiporter CemA n=1 Tax=Aphanochaete elegans TaxID=764105 RepID=A0A6H1XDP7_9CHLO|nr:chloroplast envelope membrane protein [Aphanochaete elegans]QJA13724.1 chloroplast envelope membrane protein [Aphanochaete elegans]